MRLRLGAFEIGDPLGSGGMGTVFRAVHVKERVPVAIKVMSPSQAREARALAAFRAEARAVASLVHPGIVSVLDFGVVPAELAGPNLDAYEIVAGSPYLVMELAESTLGSQPPSGTWRATREVLLSLLEALGHAHARGLVHRDIKPANVLWVRLPGEPHPRIKLSDFGLAHAIATEGEYGHGAGTPGYMAPEQFRGVTRDFGPWTDLYSLGCLAYWLVAARKPYLDRTWEELAHAHCDLPIPPLEPQFTVPDGLEAWIHRLMAKHPLERPRFAADAAHLLEQLEFDENAAGTSGTSDRRALAGEDSDVGPLLARPLSLSFNTVSSDASQSSRGRTHTLASGPSARVDRTALDPDSGFVPRDATEHPTLPPPRVRFDAALHRPPPFPVTWRQTSETVPRHLLGVGLGLFGLRALPLVGRVRERDRMWQSLARVVRDARPEAIVVRGPAGHGKTRIATWLEQRAHELGLAHTAYAQGERGRASPLLVETSRRMLALRGLDRAGMSQRVRQWLSARGVDDKDEHERRALLELVAPSDGLERPNARRFGPSTEHAALSRLFERMTVDRPLVVRIEDAQWSPDTLAFVEHFLDEGRAPVLFVLTLQDDTVAVEPAIARRVASLARRIDVTTLEVGALSTPDQSKLVRGMLHLGGALADEVVERTAGNPLFAQALVRDWVDRGLLRVTEAGFALEPGTRVSLPDSLHDIWNAHVAELVGEDTDDARALEVAASLGMLVDLDEWVRVCRGLEISMSQWFLDRAIARRLLLPELEDTQTRRLHFAHGMLRESLERRAVEGGRAAAIHGAIADLLLPRFVRGRYDVAERLALSLDKSGRGDEALEPLRVGADAAMRRAEYDRALSLLDQHADISRRLRLPEAHPTRIEALLVRAEVRSSQGAYGEADALAEEALALVDLGADDEIGARALDVAAHVAFRRGDPALAEARFTEALQRFDRLDRQVDASRCLRGLARIAEREGRRSVAFQAYLHSLELCRANDDAIGIAASLRGMGRTDTSRPEGSSAELEEALGVAETSGDMLGVGRALLALGEHALRTLRPRDAIVRFRDALELARRIGAAREEALARVGNGRAALSLRRMREARADLTEGLRTVERLGETQVELVVHVSLLMCALIQRDMTAFGHHAWAVRRLLETASSVEPEVMRILLEAGTTTHDARDAAELRVLTELAAQRSRTNAL